MDELVFLLARYENLLVLAERNTWIRWVSLLETKGRRERWWFHEGSRENAQFMESARILGVVPVDRETSKVKEPSMTREHMVIDWVGRLCEDTNHCNDKLHCPRLTYKEKNGNFMYGLGGAIIMTDPALIMTTI